MLSIQEMVNKTEEQRRQIKQQMDATGRFHPSLASILTNQSPADRLELQQTLRGAPLREFLAKSGTTGIAGAAYLVPDKVHDDLIFYSRPFDIVPLISAYVVDGWKGGDLLVDIVSDSSYNPQPFSSGGNIPVDTTESMQATASPISYGLTVPITNDLIEDANFDLVEFHIRNAAKALGEKSSELALAVLATATDGWGTVNSGTTGDADETRLVNGTTNDVVGCIRDVSADKFIVDTIVVTPESWGHSISTQTAEVGWTLLQPTEGYHYKLGNIDVLLSVDDGLHDSADAVGAAFTACVTLIFSRRNALLTARKRWGQINKYSDPVRDLSGFVASFRQDSVTLYDDSIYILTET
ncbi:MAG: hypothetical protein ACW99J_19945 [Candidatus Thorarchaeota archaeon]